MAPTLGLGLLVTVADSTTKSSSASARSIPSEIGHISSGLCVFDIFRIVDAIKPY
jgi:hypothetical protein